MIINVTLEFVLEIQMSWLAPGDSGLVGVGKMLKLYFQKQSVEAFVECKFRIDSLSILQNLDQDISDKLKCFNENKA